MEIRTVNNIRCYSGDIAPESGVVFVFGSNPEGRHGAGAAKVARERFGAIYGQGEGLQGNAYALPTKDLRVKENRGFRSISPEAITESIKKLYGTARENPDRTFCIAYRNTDRPSLNGYTGYEMMRMFAAAGPLPENILVSEEWAKTRSVLHDEPKQTNTFRERADRAISSGKLKSVGDLRDGWALVQALNGKYNYADADGKFMTKNWLDSASEFKDGKATVTRGGTVATINKEGICIAVKTEKTLHR